MPIQTIQWQNGSVRLIDQTRLPLELVYIETDDYRRIITAIKRLEVRGAPAIGIAAALGVVLGLQKLTSLPIEEFISRGEEIISELKATRPTAVNLFWALERMGKVLRQNRHLLPGQIVSRLLGEALKIMEEDRAICRAIGKNGAALIKDGFTVLTHCNAGALATADYGTALGVVYAAVEQGKRVVVFADETRPLLQGARLTTWELMQANIKVTLICDNTAAFVMQQKKIDCILVGADRIACNGDTANKIGTYNLAVLANFHRIPFYVVAPISTIDFAINSGEEIPIEERAAEEVTANWEKRTAPINVPVYNPAFDVTPHKLISAIITEKGIMYPPYLEKLKKFQNNA